MAKTFQVKYSSDDQLLNIPDNLKQRISKLRELRSQGYTHIQDKWWTMYTGKRYATINDYITENRSYL